MSVLAYAYYHLSGAKAIVDKLKGMKERYLGARATATEQAQNAREQADVAMAAAKEAAREKAADIRERWNARRSGGKSEGS